jgi:recombinational DNA repair protein (RecF pathway)
MRFSDKAVVLQTIRHGDRRYIVRLYTRGHGLLTISTTPGKSPASKVRASALLPLTLINAELTVKQNKDIHQMTEAAIATVLSNIPNSLSRLSIANLLRNNKLTRNYLT